MRSAWPGSLPSPLAHAGGFALRYSAILKETAALIVAECAFCHAVFQQLTPWPCTVDKREKDSKISFEEYSAMFQTLKLDDEKLEEILNSFQSS